MDASDWDSESESESESPITSSPWKILSDDSEWAVSLNGTIFRHPRVLLAYFRYVSFTNELAKNREEYIHLPLMTKNVKDYILNHISFRDTPEEFKEEVADLHAWVCLISQ